MLTSQAATARRLSRTLPALALAVFAVTCRDNPVAPRGGGLAHLAVQPTFRSPVNLTAFGLTIDSLRVTIVRPVADTIKDTTVFFSPDSDVIHLPLTFELKAAAETLSVTLTLSAGGVPLFTGTQLVDVSVGSAGPPVPITLGFTGPGAGVTALHITPLDTVVRLGDAFRYRVTADSAGIPVTTFYASWSTSDTLVARINAFGILQAPLTRNTLTVIVRTLSGARDSTRVTFVPTPTLLSVASGGAQTGPVGSPLALPLRARVTAADGLGVKGIPVTFAPLTGGGSVTTATVVTDTLGFAQTAATLGALVGTHTFQASAAGLTAVTFSESATAATPTQLSVNAGDAQSAIVGAAVAVAPAVLLKDAFNNPVPGVVVTYAIASGGGSVTKAVDTTNAFGIAAVGGWTLGTISGANSLSATAGALSHTFTATGLAGPASAATSAVSVDSTTLAAGHATLLHLQAKDAFGNNLTAGGLTVGFSVTGGTSTGSLSVVTDHLNGTYSAVFTGVLSGTADTVHATIGATSVTSTLPLLTVLPGAASLATSIVTVDSATLASGDSSLVHLQAKDAAGNNLTVGGLTVLFSTQGGGSTGAFSAVTDNGNGTYRAYFKAIVAGTATAVHATIGGSAVSSVAPTLSVLPGAASLATSLVTADSATLRSGDSTLVHLRAKDAAGNSLTTGGLTVLFSTQGGGSTGTFSTVTDHGDGTYSAYFRAVLSGAATSIHATIGGSPVASLAPSLSVLAGAVSAVTSIVTTTGGSVLSGSPVTLTLRAKDAAGDSLTTGGATVVFTATGGTSTGTISATTDNGNGTYTATFTGLLAGTADTIHATIGGTPVTTALPTVAVLAGAVSTATSLVTVDSATLASGDSTVVHLQAKDAAGNNITTGGATVVFSRSGVGTGSFGATVDNGNGTYSARFTALLGGSATLGATINGGAVTSVLPTLTIGAGVISVATSPVTASSGTLASGGAVTLTLVAKDGAGNAITTGGAAVVFSASGGSSTGTISATTDHANGTYTATFTGVLAGTATTIGATVNGTTVTSALPTVSVTPGAASTATSLVSSSTGALAAGATATFTLQAKDAAGNVLATGGLTVVFSVTGGTSTGTVGATVDHADGTYTASFLGGVAGTALAVHATIGGSAVTSIGAITVVPGNAVTAQSLVSVASGTVASGGGVTLTLQAKDSVGNNITTGGLTVVFTATGGTSTGTISATTDHANGTYTATFTGLVAGTPTTIGATIGGSPVTSTLPTISVTAGAASTVTSLVTVASGTVGSGSPVTVTLQTKDVSGNALTTGGASVAFTATGGTSTGTFGSVTDHGDGTYTASFTGVTAGSATTVGATIGGSPVTSTLPTLTVLAGAASTATSIVTAGLPTISSGTGTSLTLQAKDASGNNLTTGGLTVVFSASGGTSTGLIGATSDNGNGTYSATFTGVLAGTSTLIGATINGTPVSSALPNVTVTAGAISTVASVVSTSNGSVLSGGSVNLTLQAKDAAGNLLPSGGATVVFTRSGGLSTGIISATTDNLNGTYSATFTGVLAGTATTIGATINSSAVTSALPTLTVLPGAASTLTSLVSVDSAALASGHVTLLHLQTKDLAGNNLTTGGLTVTFAVSGGTGTGTLGSVTDNGNGTYQAPFTALLAGTADTVHATIGGAAVTTALPTLTVLAGAASAATSTITTAVDSVVSGAGLVVTLHAKDAAGNPIASGGATVVFTASGGTSTATFGATSDNGNGTYDATLTGVLAGTPDTIHATVNGSPVTTVLPTVFVVPGAVALSRSIITVSDSIAIAAVADTLTLQAKDSAGNNLTHGGLAVVFAITGGTSTGLITGTTDHANGTYTAIFTGIAAGTPAIIGATIGGSPVTSALPGIRVLATLHVSDITLGDSVWTAAASPHIVTRNILIGNQKTLTIEAGAVVKFDSGAGLQVGDSASSTFGGLVLDGTAGTITLTANSPTPTPAFWRGIDVQRLLGGFPWKNVLIEWGGASGACVTYSDTFGALLDMDSVRVRQCGPTHHGIQMLNGVLHFHRGVMDTTGLAGIGASNGQLEIDSSTFTGMNAGWNIVSPLVRLGPSSANKFFGNGAAAQLTAAQLPGLLRQDTLASNVENFLVFGGQPDSSAAVVTLYRQPRGASGLDYRFLSGSGLLDIGSATGQELVLDANLALGFDAGTGIVIGDSAGTRAGTIRSLGTSAADAPSLTSVPPLNSHGGWVGLEIGRLAAADTLRFVKIQYAGDSLPGRTVFRAGVWVRNPAPVPLLLDNVQVLSSGWPVSLATSGGIVVNGQGGGFDLHNSLVANNAGFQVAVAAPNVRVTGNNLAGGTIGLGGFISGGAQLTAADSIGPNTIDGNGYAVALTPGSLPAFYQTALGLTNVTDTLLLEAGSLDADAQLPHFPGFVWRALGGITVGGNATLNLAAGNTVAFDSLAGVIIGDTLPGRLTAIAPATAPVLLTSSAGPNSTWSGVAFFNLAGAGFSDTLRNVIFDRAGVFQCSGGVFGNFRQKLLRRAPKLPRAPALPRGAKGAPQRGVIVGGCETFTVLGAVQFDNVSPASLLLDSITVRGGPAFAIDASASGGGQVAVTHGQFYDNSYPNLFYAADGLNLSIDSSDIYHYGASYTQSVFAFNFSADSVTARNNWWGDIAGPGVDTLATYYQYQDSIGRAILVEQYAPTAYAPFLTAPNFPVTGPAVSIVATPSSNAGGASAGLPLADSIRARVLDAEGRGVSGVTISWSTAALSGSVLPGSGTTDVGGRTGQLWTPGTVAITDTAFASTAGVLLPAAFQWTVFPGVTVSENWQLIPDARTQGVVSADSDSVTFTSTARHGELVTHAFDVYGNATTPSTYYYFDDVPATGFSQPLGIVDSIRADTAFFTVNASTPSAYQLHGTYPGPLNAILNDSVLINVNPVGVAMQISGDSVFFSSLCASPGPVNFYCQGIFSISVVDSGGVAVPNQSSWTFGWANSNPTLATIDSTRGPTNALLYLTANANGIDTVIATQTGGPPLAQAADTLIVVINQVAAQIVVTPGNVNLGLGDTTVFHAAVTDQGGAAIAVQPAIHWMAPSPIGPGEFAGVVKLDSAADSLLVRLDSGFYNGSNFDWEAVVRAFVERAPGDTISGQGVLINPIVYDQFSITANGQGHAAVDTGAHKMFVVNGGYLEGLNIDNDAPIGTIGIGSSGSWISIDQDSNRVFVADPVTNSVHIVDAVSFTPLGTANLPGTPNGLAVSPVDHRTYTAMRFCPGGPPLCTTGTYIVPIDGSLGADTAIIADSVRLGIDTLAAPQGLAFNPATGLLYLSTSTGLVYVYDPVAKIVVDSIVVNPGSLLQGMAFNPVNGLLYVADWTGGSVFKVDPATKATTNVGSVNNPYDVAIDPVHNKIYASASSNTLLVQIDGATDIYHWLLAGTNYLDEPGNVAVDPRTGVVFVPHPTSLTIYQFYGHSFPAPLTAPRRMVAGSQPTPRSITPRVPAGLLPQGGTRRPPPARRPGITFRGILPGAPGSKKTPK